MSAIGYASVDGGGTKTAIVLVDSEGTEVARVITSTSNAAIIGHDQAGAVLRAGLQEAVALSGIQLGGVWLGLSGADRPEDQRRLMPYLEDLCATIRLTNDGELVLSALPDGIGLAVVAGTGSIAFGRSATGERIRAGGWGQIFGDEGSGYDLARRMLRAYAGAVDGRSTATSCTEAVMSHLSLTEPFQVIQWVYAGERSKADIAALSSIVLKEAQEGDEVAQDIVKQSAASLAETARAAARRLGLEEPLPMALTGGLFVHAPFYRDAFLEALKPYHRISVQIVDDPALAAARAMASTS